MCRCHILPYAADICLTLSATKLYMAETDLGIIEGNFNQIWNNLRFIWLIRLFRYPEYYGVPTEDPQMQCAVKSSVQGFYSPCDSYILLDPESLPRYISFLRQIFQKDWKGTRTRYSTQTWCLPNGRVFHCSPIRTRAQSLHTSTLWQE